jgi:putative membrane-bound dehydrogenase-like protein
MPRTAIALASALAVVLTACGGGGTKKTATTPRARTPVATATTAPAVIATPGVRIPNVAPDTSISLPQGFTAYDVADGFKNPTSIALAPDRSAYVSDAGGTVYRLADANGDGVFEQSPKFASGFKTITGLMVAPDGTLYVSSTSKVTTVRDTNGDGTGDEKHDIITGLPTGRHQNNGLAIGPDGKLYITNGSTCDECVEQDERSASVLQANIDGSLLRVYAGGLRNPYDLLFDDRGRLWASDNGSDAPCATIDELDLIVAGGDYGWPYGSKGCDPYTAGTPPVADLGLHTAATGLAIYNGSEFPATYRGDFFITLWGDLGFTPQRAGHILVRVVIDESSGTPKGTTETFGTGFSAPIDVVVDRDGSLLVLDYGTGKLYRIVYTG